MNTSDDVFEAIQTGNREQVAELVRKTPDLLQARNSAGLSPGADPNVKQQGGWTPLHQAAAHGHIEMLNLLLRHGADVDSMNDHGATPLDMAIEKGRPEVARILRSRGSVE